MAISTDLNVTPYFDDFDANNQFARILFKPSVPVQTRELNQVQSIMQNQFEILGSFVFKEGAVTDGANIARENIDYVKIADTFPANTSTVSVSDFSSGYLVDATSNLVMEIFSSLEGFEVKNPDLKTIYGKYVTTGNTTAANGLVSDVNTFTAGRQVTHYVSNAALSSATITNSGTGYSNSDTITFSSTFGGNAIANVTTDASGNITSISFSNTGSGYRYVEDITATIDTSSGLNANIVAVVNAGANLQIANASFLVAGNNEFNVIGQSLRITVDDGSIFQKGTFLNIQKQSAFVKPHTTAPVDMVMGFETAESIVNSSSDSTLLDNAQGFSNFKAPGADRLVLAPTLTPKTTTIADTSNTFFPIMRFNSVGEVVEAKQQSPLGELGKTLALRRYEADGNYSKKKFLCTFGPHSTNSQLATVQISPGIAYVGGFRQEITGKTLNDIRKSTDFANVESATVSQSFGNYVILEEMVGTFDFNNSCEVFLLDTAGNRISTSGVSVPTVPTTNASTNTTVGSIAGTVTGAGPAFTGNVIGRARIKSLIVDDTTVPVSDPSATFRAFLFDVQIKAGKSFDDVRSVSYFTGSNAGKGFADVKLTVSPRQKTSDGTAISVPNLVDPQLRTHIRRLGQKAVKTLEPTGTSNTQYHYRTTLEGDMTTSGVVDFTLTGNQVFAYSAGGTLSDDEEKEVLLISNGTAAAAQTTVRTGTITTAAGSNVISGSATTFTADLREGDFIRTTAADSDDEFFQVVEVRSQTSIQVDRDAAASEGSVNYKRYYPPNVPIDIRGISTSNVQISSDQKTMTFNATRGDTLESTLPVRAYVNIRRNQAKRLDKTLTSNVFVRIDCSNNAGGTTGSWCLGAPDVMELQAVYVADDYSTITTDLASNSVSDTYNYVEHFVLDDGQKDGYYDLSKLILNSSRDARKGPPTITSASKIVPVFKVYKTDASGGGIGFYTVDSYPVDDASTTLPSNKIRTQEIPVFRSPSTGETYDLRDSVDYRRVTANTANTGALWTNFSSISTGVATLNPATTISFSGEQFNFAPRKNLQVDYQYYLPRIDSITMSETGRVSVIEGASALSPVPPVITDESSMVIGEISLPPYPTLSPAEAREYGRPDYAITYSDKQIRGYTMKDVGRIDDSVKRLKEVVSLNSLEKSATDLNIPSAADPTLDRFKNGILVDDFDTKKTASQQHPEFKASFNQALTTVSARHKQVRIPLDLNIDASTGVQKTGNNVSLPYSHQILSQVDSATKVRTVATATYAFRGKVQFLPTDYDNWMDVRHPPDQQITNTIDIGAGSRSLAQIIEQDEDFQKPSTEVINSRVLSRRVDVTRNFTTTQTDFIRTQSLEGIRRTTRSFQDQTITTNTQITTRVSRNVLDSRDTSDTVNLGEFVTDIRNNPFIRDQEICCFVNGLKPSTIHYAFFNKTAIAEHVRPATVRDSNRTDGSFTEEDFEPTGAKGATLRSNSRGELFFIFSLPAQTFYTGKNEMLVMNQPLYDAVDQDPNSHAEGYHNSVNFGVNKGSSSLTLKDVEFEPRRVSRNVVTTENTISNRTVLRNTRTVENLRDVVEEQGGGDPLAQTFFVKTPSISSAFSGTGGALVGTINAPDSDGIFVTKVDIFFNQKDPNLGCSVQIIECDDNTSSPTHKVLPYSKVHKRSSEVSTSQDASVATTFVFSGLVHLKANRTYGIMILADGGSPLYEVWTHATGQPDIQDPTRISNKDLHEGSLYCSGNGRNWVPLSREDLKYTLYHARFTQASGNAVFYNSNIEFFSCNTTNGVLASGERAFVWDGYSSSNIAGNVTFTSSNTEVTGQGTAFDTLLSVGQYIVLSNGSSFDVKQIQSISNSSHLDLKGFPSFDSTITTNTYIYVVPTGVVYSQSWTDQGNSVILSSSSANTSDKFEAGDTVIGVQSSGNVVIQTVDDYAVHSFDNLSYILRPGGTYTTQYFSANASSGRTTTRQFPTNDRNYLLEDNFLRSHSNQPDNKSINITMNLFTEDGRVSPVIEHTLFDVVGYNNIINNDTTNEYKPESGSATAKFISKVFQLDSALDSEDIKFLLTANKPQTSDIKVFAKFNNSVKDPEEQIESHWTELTLKIDQTTDGANKYDVAEYEFNLPTTPPSDTIDGAFTVTSGSATLTASGVNPVSAGIVAGDIVKVAFDVGSSATTYQIERVASVTSSTIVLDREAEFDTNSGIVQKITAAGERTAFADPQRNGILTYFNGDKVRITGYDSVQFKIVMTASNAAQPPELFDYRAICLTV